MANLTFEETFEKLLADKKYSTIKDVLTTMNPSDIAAMLESVGEDVCQI